MVYGLIYLTVKNYEKSEADQLKLKDTQLAVRLRPG